MSEIKVGKMILRKCFETLQAPMARSGVLAEIRKGSTMKTQR